MSNKKLFILAVIATVMLVWAVVQWRISNAPRKAVDGVVYLIQGLDPADIGTIEIKERQSTVTLKRDKEGFVVVNKDNYPADTARINDLLGECLEIKTGELYTDDKRNHKDLGVTEADAEGIVKFFRSDGTLLTGIVIGKSRQAGRGCFIRLAASDEVYVTDERPTISERAMNYIDQEIISVNQEDIESVTISSPNDFYTLRETEGRNVILEDLPEGKKLKADVYGMVFTALTGLYFQDVKAGSSFGQQLNFNRKYICSLKDSTVYTIDIANKDDKTYITCRAEFTDTTPVTKERAVESQEQLKQKEAKLLAKRRAKKFTAAHQGWIYEIAGYKAANLTKGLDEILEDVERPAEQKPAADPNL